MIKLTQGDLLKQDDVDAIVNTVNCVGVMGKGIALQFKNKWPANFTEYADVRPLIESAFELLSDVEVRLFEPAGAPNPKTMEVRTKRPRMTPA